jgi:hypothetical protein
MSDRVLDALAVGIHADRLGQQHGIVNVDGSTQRGAPIRRPGRWLPALSVQARPTTPMTIARAAA